MGAPFFCRRNGIGWPPELHRAAGLMGGDNLPFTIPSLFLGL
ncbi:MAG: hypothetical protein QOF07_2586 [Bradyrhizobium sp.]|jgi:hypothetical protein|nr:hypothetical protein [Bradyrhizobium sp.]